MASAVVVRRLWRWPVKSMQGVEVDHLDVTARGALGDRQWAVLDGRSHRQGEPVSARARPELLRWRAEPGPGGRPLLHDPEGRQWEWDDPRLAARLEERLGFPVTLSGEGGFADLADSLLLTSEASHSAVEAETGPVDLRRWRTNLHVGGDGLEPFAELAWEGRRLRVGTAEADVLHPCPRCAIPTWQPDGSRRDPALLTGLLQHFDGRMGMNLRPRGSGRVSVGDVVAVAPAAPRSFA